MDIRDHISANLRRYRKAMKCSQEDLAHRAGLHRTYISGVERGARNPSALALEKIAKPLGIPVWKLLYDGQD